MARPKAAQRVAAANVSLTQLLSPARAAASRTNGARSNGPKSAEGKARSACNALKHGLRAEKFVVVGDEDPQEFAALEAALTGELAPEGALQTFLAGRIVRAVWRLARADQIEAELFARQMTGLLGDGDLGLALIRDGNGARAFDTLLRYRGTAQAELFRTLRTLKALQAEAAHEVALPNQPEARAIAGESHGQAAPPLPAPVPASRQIALAGPAPAPAAARGRCAASSDLPIEPEGHGNPGESARAGCRARSPAGLGVTAAPG